MANAAEYGEVSPGGDPDVRVLGDLTVTKIAVDPKMSNNCYLLHCAVTDESVLIDAAAEPERLLELIGDTVPAVDRHHPPALGPPPRARGREVRPPGAPSSSPARPTPTRSRSRPG